MTETPSTVTDKDLRRAFDVTDPAPQEIRDRSKVKIRKDSILVSGDATFFTIQGEGRTLGRRCVFCRLHNCNLACSWCDAFYTWFEDAPEFWLEPKRWSFEECAQSIMSKWQGPPGAERVIFSGGEPLIQKHQIDTVWAHLDTFTGKHWTAEIETNGTLMPTEYQLSMAQINCSPKLSNSENKEHMMIKPRVLKALDDANTAFKFVCKDESDLDEIEQKYLPHINRNKVIIMPEGIVEKEITAHARALYEPCLMRGFDMTPRFQAVFADGARRGV